MGVRGLQTFVNKNVPQGLTNIDIKQEIYSWKVTNPFSDCLIVIDLLGFTKISNEDKIQQICGGRYKQLQAQFELFCQGILDAGAKLAFFVDGPHQTDKDEVWFRRQDEHYANELKIFDGIANGLSIAGIVENVQDLSIGYVALLSPLQELCKRFGYFHVSIQNECDLELAQYANEHKAMAIIANDSDFLIFNGTWQYWSSDSLDWTTMKTKCYSRYNLCKELHLSQEQMSLLATLAGNDIISADKLNKFHKSFKHYWKKFYNIAEYVRTVPVLPKQLTQKNLSVIAYDCFGVKHEANVKLLQTSIQSYDIYRKLSTDDTEELGYGVNGVYIWMKGIPYAILLRYIDMRQDGFSCLGDLLIPWLQRQSGIVHKHMRARKTKCYAIMKLTHQDRYEKIELRPRYPDCDISLKELLLQDDDDLDFARFCLLAWQITGDRNGIPEIASFPNGYFVSCLALYYLVKVKLFTVAEADQILSTIHAASNGKIPDKIAYPTHLNNRDLILGHLFIYLHGFITKSMAIVGLRKLTEVLLFDGIYFHNLAQMLRRNSSRQLYDSVIEPITQLRSIYANL